jgi:hypothetical protein
MNFYENHATTEWTFNVYKFNHLICVYLERTSEELPSEITLVASPALVKPEPIPATPDGESGRSEGSLRNSTQEPSTDSEPREGSRDSVEDDPLTLVSNPVSVLRFILKVIQIICVKNVGLDFFSRA